MLRKKKKGGNTKKNRKKKTNKKIYKKKKIEPAVNFHFYLNSDSAFQFDHKIGYQNVLYQFGAEYKGGGLKPINKRQSPEMIKEILINGAEPQCPLIIPIDPDIGLLLSYY